MNLKDIIYESKVIKLNKMPSFSSISKYFPRGEEKKLEFEYDGKKIVGERKVITDRRGGYKSDYLHIWIYKWKGSSSSLHYREMKNGTFKLQ